MPKYVKESNRNRFRIVPTDEKFYIQERKSHFFFPCWKTIKSDGEWASTIIIFDNVQVAKDFIDDKIKKEEQAIENSFGGKVYYP